MQEEDQEEGQKGDKGAQSLRKLLGDLDGAIDTYAQPASPEIFRNRGGTMHSGPLVAYKGPSIGSLSGDAQHRIEQVIQAARNVYKDFPPEYRETMVQLTTAQALQESGSRLNSGLAQKNNFFGINGTGTAGSQNFMTTEYHGGMAMRENASFAINNTPEDSFLQHQEILTHTRYTGVQGAAKQGEFEGAATALQRAGYATDPAYAANLMAINERIVKPMMAKMDQRNATPALATRDQLKVENGKLAAEAAANENNKAAKPASVATNDAKIDEMPKPDSGNTKKDELGEKSINKTGTGKMQTAFSQAPTPKNIFPAPSPFSTTGTGV